MNKDEYKNKFRRCILEYTSISDGIDEDGEQDPNAMGGDPNAMGGDPNAMGGDPNAMGGDPNAVGGDPNAAGGDPNAMGGDPNAAGGDPNAMGGDPNAAGGDPNGEGGEAQSPEGFQPQGVDQESGDPGMDGGPDASEEDSDEEVIDVDDLTNSQKKTEKKIDSMNHRFSDLLGRVDSLLKRMEDNEGRTKEAIEQLKVDMEHRNPTPVEKMTMRSTKSMPYGETPEEWWKTKAPDNYDISPDNNGVDEPQYKITKSDIDNFSDWNSISKDLDGGNMSLHDILGY